MVKEVGHVDMVLCNGDSCEGPQRKSNGYQVQWTDLAYQAEEAVGFLDMIDCDTYRISQGTAYHVGKNMSQDYLVAKLLNGVHKSEHVLDVEKISIHASHYQGVSKSGEMYHSTSLAREAMLAKLNQEEFGKFHILLFSHTHYFYGVFSNSTLALGTYCWKGRDDYAAENSLKWNPDVGFLLFEVDGENYTWEKHPYKFGRNDLFDVEKI